MMDDLWTDIMCTVDDLYAALQLDNVLYDMMHVASLYVLMSTLHFPTFAHSTLAPLYLSSSTS